MLEQRHDRQQPRTEAAFHRAAVGPGAAEQRRRHVQMHPQIAGKQRFGLAAGFPDQPGDLVFVLVGENLVIALRHRRADRRRGRCDPRAIAPRKAFALVGGKVVGAKGDLVGQAPGRRGRGSGAGRRRFRVQHRPAAKIEGPTIGRDGLSVEFDRLHQRGLADRHQPALPGRSQHQHVGIEAVADQRAGKFRGVEQRQPVLKPALKSERQGVVWNVKIRIPGEGAGDGVMAVDHRAGASRAGERQRGRTGRDHQIAADQRIRLARRHPDRGDVVGPPGQPQMHRHRAALLGDPGHVDQRRPEPVDMRRLRHDRADGHHALAANPGDDRVPGARNFWKIRLRQRRQIECRRCFAAQRAALDGDEGRAEPGQAGKILVAGRLIDRPFAAQFGLYRHDRHTVGLHPAIAAALADIGVDEHPPVGIGKAAALAPAAFLGGTGLDIKKHRYAFDFA